MHYDFYHDHHLPNAKVYLDGKEYSSAMIRSVDDESGVYEIVVDGKVVRRRAGSVRIIWIDRAPAK